MLRKLICCGAALLVAAIWFSVTATAQEKIARVEKGSSMKSKATKDAETSTEAAEKKKMSDLKYRLLQSNGLLVETAYHQEKNELQHTFAFARSNGRDWSFKLKEEIPLGSGAHQLSVSMPAQLAISGETGRGVGDVRVEYSYFLLGENGSRVTVTPAFGVSLPTGNRRKDLGYGATGYSVKVPVSAMITKRFQSNTTVEAVFTPRARNIEGERANLRGYEIGQSFVWLARPKLNFLVEGLWERSQKVVGRDLRDSEREFFISPGVRWAHALKNGVLVIPGIAVPFGVGPSRGEHGIFLSIAFEHSIKKEH